MTKTLHYVFDPLCGWCYGAGAAVSAVAEAGDVALELLPSGLFSGAGARPMDDAFASFAWTNDQRIERLAGRRFSERYREQVLGSRQQGFDSGPATVALAAVSLTAPGGEREALEAIQLARFVDGRDITRPDTLANILASLGLAAAAARLDPPDAELQAAVRDRVARARELLGRFGARGVPAFILDVDGRQELLDTGGMYADARALLDRVAAA